MTDFKIVKSGPRLIPIFEFVHLEIKFRGKAVSDNQWVYGYYVFRDGYKKGMIYEPNGLGHDVIIGTVSQFTGLNDKKDTEIYRGDIVQAQNECWGNKPPEPFIVDYDNELGGWKLDRDEDALPRFYTDWVVIGNIYDNVELLTFKGRCDDCGKPLPKGYSIECPRCEAASFERTLH